LFNDIDTGLFDPDAILPADRTASVGGLARLGSATTFYGQAGFTECERAARSARELVGFVKKDGGVAGESGTLLGPERARAQELVNAVRHYAMEAANVLQDAVEHSPRSGVLRKIHFNEKLHSNTAKRLKEKYDPPSGTQ
jgi:hypothetical protein